MGSCDEPFLELERMYTIFIYSLTIIFPIVGTIILYTGLLHKVNHRGWNQGRESYTFRFPSSANQSPASDDHRKGINPKAAEERAIRHFDALLNYSPPFWSSPGCLLWFGRLYAFVDSNSLTSSATVSANSPRHRFGLDLLWTRFCILSLAGDFEKISSQLSLVSSRSRIQLSPSTLSKAEQQSIQLTSFPCRWLIVKKKLNFFR